MTDVRNWATAERQLSRPIALRPLSSDPVSLEVSERRGLVEGGHALAALQVRRYSFEMGMVFDLWFTREYDYREDTELHIGIYASEGEALAAIEALREKPGFSEHPDGFDVVPTKLGLTGWQEGFVTSIGPPPKDAAGQAFDLPAWLQ